MESDRCKPRAGPAAGRRRTRSHRDRSRRRPCRAPGADRTRTARPGRAPAAGPIAKVAGDVEQLGPVGGDPHDIAVAPGAPDAEDRRRRAALDQGRKGLSRAILRRHSIDHSRATAATPVARARVDTLICSSSHLAKDLGRRNASARSDKMTSVKSVDHTTPTDAIHWTDSTSSTARAQCGRVAPDTARSGFGGANEKAGVHHSTRRLPELPDGRELGRHARDLPGRHFP